MSRNEIMERVTAIFQDVFDDDSIVLSDTTTAEDIAGWDSLIHITIIAACESEFGIKFSMREIINLRNVGDLVDIIASRQQ